MITSKILNHYENGGKIRCRGWNKKDFIYSDGDYVVNKEGHKTLRVEMEIDLNANWEIYQEPKKELMSTEELFKQGATHVQPGYRNATIIEAFCFKTNCIRFDGRWGGVKKHLEDLPQLKWTANRKTWFNFYGEEVC